MKKIIINITILIIIFSCRCFAFDLWQADRSGLKGGILYGGPMPVKWSDEFSGNPIFGAQFGLFADYVITEKLTFSAELMLSYKGVDFTAAIMRDTIVEVEMLGEKGTIPTFYTADIVGGMDFFYIDLPVILSYDIGISTFLAGIQLSYLAGGSYKGDAHVVVGEGGFYDDIIEHFDNFEEVSRLDFAICIGGEHELTERLKLSILASRSIIPLMKGRSYNSQYIDVGNMYNTFVTVSLLYSL